jgi:ketosteroid isomerase-like protein
MATAEDVANGLTELVKQGKFEEAAQKYYSVDIVSTEPFGEPATVRGIDAVNEKGKHFFESFEIKGVQVEGPFVNGDQFVTEYKVETIDRKSGEQSELHEVALYTVNDGKIVDERFYYKR